MAKVLMTAREPLQRGTKLVKPGDTFAAESIGEAKKLKRQNLAHYKSIVAPLNRAMEADEQRGRATGKYHTK